MIYLMSNVEELLKDLNNDPVLLKQVITGYEIRVEGYDVKTKAISL